MPGLLARLRARLMHPGVPRVPLPPGCERMLELVSPRTGIIRELLRCPKGAEEPELPVIYQANLCDFSYGRLGHSVKAGGGKGETEAEAIVSAIGEAVERYCCFQALPGSMTHATLAERGPRAFSPADGVLFSEAQYTQPGFPLRRFDPGAPLAWLRGRCLHDGGEWWLPACLVQMAPESLPPEEWLCPVSSNGAACGPDVPHAALSGLLELIERDAFLVTWMNRLPAPRLDVSCLDGLPRRIQAHYARFGVETHLFAVTSDIPVHVVMAVLVDRTGQGPAAVVGLASSLEPRQAVRRALVEACQVRPGEAERLRENPPAGRLRGYEDVKTLIDHAAFFSMPERLAELDFLLRTPRTVRLEELKDYSTGSVAGDLERCAAAVASVGSRAAYVDLTQPDIAALGLRVVRVLATGLQPIHFGHGQERLGGRRLWDAPRAMGLTPLAPDALNPCPHPFA